MLEPVKLTKCGHHCCVLCLNELFLKDTSKKCPMCRVEHATEYRNVLNVLDIDTKFQAKLREQNQEAFDKAWLDAYYGRSKHPMPL